MYWNFINVVGMRAVVLLITRKGKRDTWIVDYENSAMELGMASNTWKMDFYSWVSCMSTLDFYSAVITYISVFPRFSSEFLSLYGNTLYGFQLNQDPLQARLYL